MLAPSVVEKVSRLLAEDKLSHRKIALLTGVSRGTIGAIASGRRPDYQRLRRDREADPLEPAGPPERCPRCGGKVYHPCLLCRARSLAARSRKPAAAPPREPVREFLGFQLKEEHRLRYEEIHEAKLHAGEDRAAAAYDELILPSLTRLTDSPCRSVSLAKP
jgi:transcriptional regulator with XRE-family HTH domain